MTTYAKPRHSAYQQSAVLTAPPGRLIVMLYDGARRFLYQAATAMRDGDMVEADEKLLRGERIIEELLVTLDLDAGEIAHRLQGLYLFYLRQLSSARGSRDADKIDWVWEKLGELREAWDQIAATAETAA